MRDRIVPNHRTAVVAALVGMLVATAGCRAPKPQPPIARVVPHESTIHGHTRVDNYRWLQQRGDDEVIAYLEAENAYTDRMMRHTRRLQERLFREMKGRIQETDLSVPVQRDDYYYYSRTIKGKQYPVYCRKRGNLDAPEEIILDVNALAEGHDYFRLGAHEVSPNHKLLAYSTDTDGSETYTLRIKNLETGELLAEEIRNTYYSLAWSNQGLTLFYTTLDDAKRPFKAWRHRIETDPSEDVLVHHEEDEAFFVSVSKTRSRDYILLSLNSQITSEVRFVGAYAPLSTFRVVEPRRNGVEYEVEHHGDHFYIVTNDEAVNFKLVRAPVSDPGKANWEVVIRHRPEVKIEGVDAFAEHLAVYERENGLRRLWVIGPEQDDAHYVEFPDAVYTFFPTGNEEFGVNTLRFNYTSMVTPPSVYDYNMDTRERELKKREEVLGGYDPSRYASDRIFATAADGTHVPISLVHRMGIERDGTNPTLLYGYGSYGASIEPRFSSDRVSLLDRGVVFAIAHVRGGGALGRPWYEDGKYLRKRNTFTDFIACAEHLVAEGYTSPDHLAAMGGSAGGLLMGAVTNMRPDLFNVVVAKVPFVDVVNTMLDSAIPLTVTEFEEWGDPKDKRYYEYMVGYSPYDNVTAKAYPNMLITAGLNDPRVQYWEPAKWTAKLRAMKTDENVLLLRTNMGAGHGGASGRYDRLRQTAFDYTFILDRLGVR